VRDVAAVVAFHGCGEQVVEARPSTRRVEFTDLGHDAAAAMVADGEHCFRS
jgi:hypothetical protein